MSSLCDTCHSPGACCKKLTLNYIGGSEVTVREGDDPKGELLRVAGGPLPFEPLERRETIKDADGLEYSAWYWSCPLLGPDGRCTDYQNRPYICREYEPASDGLCVYYKAADLAEAKV